ncbi:DUF2231 domain-containing protein [Pararhizobium haloflavum]|uniref:DUF2231 domain-containing protein n=1 Tax=Pararhizobium haloflavum TaxID=2037914 RepID=UPI000C19EBDF|nr:DUF2231 domain-containing protein [Pararhizobium haloflavum]
MPSYSPSPIVVGRHPVHGALVAFPIVCFTLTLLSDVAYWQTSNLLWQHFAEWLLLVGVVMGALAAVAGIVDHVLHRHMRSPGAGWPYAIGSGLVLLLAFINNFVHAGDGWTGVMPYGLALSAITVIALVVTEVIGHATIHRRGAGVYVND